MTKSPSSYCRSLPPRANPGQGTLLTTHHSLLGEQPAQRAEGTVSEPNRSWRFQRWPAAEPGGEVQEGRASRVSIPRDGERGRPWPSAGLGASARGGGIRLLPTPGPPALCCCRETLLKGRRPGRGDAPRRCKCSWNQQLARLPRDYTPCGLSKQGNEAERADLLTFCPFTPLQSHFPQPEQPWK